MPRPPLSLLLALVLVPAGLGAAAPAAAAPAEVTRTVAASGTGVGMYPAFDPAVQRYALTTTGDTAGRVEVTATTTDPDGTVLVDGRPAGAGRATVTGLEEGDEISVVIEDSAGRSVHSLVYLPAGFPRMTETVAAAPGSSPGHVLVNLSKYRGDGSPNFEAALDRRGVPVHVRSFPATEGSADLKPGGAPGHYTVFRGPTPTPGRTGHQLVVLDEQFREVRRHETVGLVDTDMHDALVRPDGSRIMLAYEPNTTTGLTDSVIQEVDAAGRVVHTWNSGEHLDVAAETTHNPGEPDYSHINSVEVMTDGDLLASFRHTSSVLKIAWSDRPGEGISRGDVVWRLGGRRSDFTFPDDPSGNGPCAQHTATELPNGNILVFDNGSVPLGAAPVLCADQANPTGPSTTRGQTRVTEYALDTVAGTATTAWNHEVPGRFAFFAGSVRRLAGGTTLIGWAAERRALASEVDGAGTTLWELATENDYLSYRVAQAVVPDRVRPEVAFSTPAGASYARGEVVVPGFRCTDRGGSSLQTCSGPEGALDTSTPGRHSFAVTATDGAGNSVTAQRSYVVEADAVWRPDAIVRGAGTAWAGNNVYGPSHRQQVGQGMPRRGGTLAGVVRVQNEGNRADRVVLRGADGSARFRVRYLSGRTDVTDRVVRGSYARNLSAGASFDLRVLVTRQRSARPGDTERVVVTATSGSPGRPRDSVAWMLRATR